MLEYLKLLPIHHKDFSVQLKIGEALGRSFRKDEKARTYLLPKLAKSEYGRIYFYESFVDIDYLNFYYKDALVNYYLPNTSKMDTKKHITDVVFAKTLEFIAHLKAHQKKKAIRTAYELFKQIPVETHWKEFAHPFPYARFISVYFIYLHFTGNLNNTNKQWSINKIVELAKVQPQPSFVFAQLLMALNYCENYHEIITIYNEHNNLIFKNRKTNLDYLPNLNCINNAFAVLELPQRIEPENLDLHFSDLARSSHAKKTLI